MAMNIIFHCYGGAHSSVVTAAIYLGILEAGKTPTTKELLQIPYFDQQIDSDHGKMRFMGNDPQGNQVYIIGKRGFDKYFESLVYDFLSVHAIKDKLVVVDTLSGVNLAMRIGGFLSRKLGLTFVGRPIVIWGTQKAYQNFVQIALNALSK